VRRSQNVATLRPIVLALVLAAATWRLTAPASAEAPQAAFVWFPSSPLQGEAVSLASTSTDATSPITSWSWDVHGSRSFEEGESLTTTTFDVPGNHIVRLRVTAADGSFSEVADTIVVRARPLTEMLPFPIVRVVSVDRSGGIDLRLLAVEAPPGARITVTCRGRGCPPKPQSTSVSTIGVESVTVSFPRLRRFLRVGDSLEVRVTKTGEIGKYTRLIVRSGRPPRRFDACLRSMAPAPVACPATTATLTR
jgi:PKD repeat protein